MATKSKNFKYSLPVKIICFVVSCLFICLGSITICKGVNAYSENESYFQDVLSGWDYQSIDSTYSFSEIYKKHVSSIMLKALFFKDGTEETFKKNASEIIEKKCNDIINDDIGVYNFENMSYAHLSYICEGYYTEYDTKNDYFRSDNGEPVALPEGADRLYFNDGKIYSVVFDKKAMYQEIFKDTYSFFVQKMSDIDRVLTSVLNLKYAVVNKTDKTIYSNVKSIDGKSSQKDFSSYFSGFEWSVFDNSERVKKINFDIPSSESQNIYSKGFDYSAFYQDETPILLFASIEKSVELYTTRNFSFCVSPADEYEVYLAFDKNMSSGSDAYSEIKGNIISASKVIKSSIIMLSVCFIAVLFAVIYLITTAGRQEKGREIKKTFTDKIFNEIHMLVSLLLAGILAVIYIALLKNTYESSNSLLINSVCFFFAPSVMILAYCVFIELLTSISRHIKSKTLFKHTILGALFTKTWNGKHSKKTFRIVIILSCVYILAAVVISIIFSADIDDFLLPAVLFFVMPFIALIMYCAYKLDEVVQQMETAKPDSGIRLINPADFPFWLRPFAKEILLMQQNTRAAVESAVKDQKMKTQLITNVSHDLKTPLTVLINYSDLLSQCEINNEEAEKYIEIISEKSSRLKKLIEDLTEAAKASSGTIQTNIVSLNLNEMAVQIAGETEDALRQKGLKTVLKLSEKPVFVSADSNLTYRVLENLMSNVQKYAMPYSRVYINVGSDKSIGISNISEKPLNISPDELKSRFIRGDEARTTEGSGLGLAIADDLCKIQNAKMKIFIDGDLFKVVIWFEK